VTIAVGRVPSSRQAMVAAHAPGWCRRRSASAREDHSHRDALVMHDVSLFYQPHNTINNINALEFYHEMPWNLHQSAGRDVPPRV
jgi:hypothetical protein